MPVLTEISNATLLQTGFAPPIFKRRMQIHFDGPPVTGTLADEVATMAIADAMERDRLAQQAYEASPAGIGSTRHAMNEERAKRGIGVERVVEALIRTFNAQDRERHAETLNYPHIRFATGSSPPETFIASAAWRAAAWLTCRLGAEPLAPRYASQTVFQASMSAGVNPWSTQLFS